MWPDPQGDRGQMLSPGQTIDRYTVDSIIGHGGTAVVYLVRHNQLGSQHALKVLSLSSGAIRQRLLREGRVQAALQHTNIVTVTDVLDVSGNPGLLMEHVDGPALDQAMRRYKIGLRDAMILFRGIVAGVRAAHREGLVHRDLKPANVLLFRSPEGFVPKVTDFGLAKVLVGRGAELGQTRQGIAMGTPAYMAPEQIHDARAVDQRADIFSLGCILYELATRQRAFPGDQALEIYNNIVVGRYAPPEELVPDLPDAVIQAIDGCLIVDRERRIPDCDTLLKVLSGRSTWEILPHPVPDEVSPTEEVSRDIPDMPIATVTGAQGGTPAPAPTRGGIAGAAAAAAVGGPAPTVSVSQEQAQVVTEVPSPDPTDTFDPESVDGTLGGDVALEKKRGLGVLIAVGVVLLLMFVGGGVVLAGLSAGIGALAITTPSTPGPGLSIDGASTAAGPSEGSVTRGDVGTVEPIEPIVEADIDADTAGAPAEEPVGDPVVDREVVVVPVERTAPVARTGIARISSVPLTVELAVDGVDQGRTPKKLVLTPGRHTVQVSSGGRTASFDIHVEAGADVRWCYSFEAGTSSAGRCP